MTCVSASAFSLCFNGVSHCYFKGGRGLRQGDPMSPYLFTLIMEIFNLIMIKKIEESQSFKYHFGCKEIKLTHLYFANDLLVVCNDDKDSEVNKSALNDFSMVFGLFPDLSKSTILFGSVNDRERSALLSVLLFQCGKLLMKYLGVPLLLIASVLASMHVYWASMYLLPYGVIREIKKFLKRFLWNPGDSAQGKARVSWKNVCKLKENGGLGLRSLKE
ncbi:RNA-directed DNA polymerase, eukaryota, reverse transcriptase zinc-binding domain protein [Tanacetum coccineum]